MSENIKELKAVQQKIEDLLKKKASLRQKELKGQIIDEEQVGLEGITELLTALERQEKFWQGQVDKENKPEVEIETFKKADSEWIETVTGVDTTYREWTSFVDDLESIEVVPSNRFKESFENVSKAWHLRTEAGRRIFLNLFLEEIVLLPEFEGKLKIFPEIELSVETKGPKKRKLTGKTDYTVGFGFGKGYDLLGKTPPRELHLVAIEAKRDFGDDDLWQCVAEAATLYKSRKDAGKQKCSVWGVLSNANRWIFIYIDEKGLLWRAEEISMILRSYDEAQVTNVYRMLYYVTQCCFQACTPKSSPVGSTIEF